MSRDTLFQAEQSLNLRGFICQFQARGFLTEDDRERIKKHLPGARGCAVDAAYGAVLRNKPKSLEVFKQLRSVDWLEQIGIA